MSPFLIGLVGFLIVAFSVIPGLLLWWPSRNDRTGRSDLGVALMTGALIAFAVLTIQVLIERNNRARDEARRVADAQQSFELTLSLQKDLTGIRLERKDLRGFYLYGKILKKAVLVSTDLRSATLSWANLSDARMHSARLGGAIMNNATLTRAKLDNANLEAAILTEARMLGASLAGATIVDADLSSVFLPFGDLKGAHLEGASLAGATLTGADMSNASVDEDTSFAGAVYDKTTVWPEGVNQDRCRKGVCEAH